MATAGLERSVSQTSTLSTSNPRNRSIQRVRPTKRPSTTSLRRSRSRAPSPADDSKSLTSFPSLSPSPDPDPEPALARLNGWFKPNTATAPAPALPPDDATPKQLALDAVNTSIPASASTPTTPTVRRVTRSSHQMVGSLMGLSSAARDRSDRSALFDDTPADPANAPGNLHFASDQHIRDALAHTGAVPLVRQLAADLAQRDAQVTALRRHAEERERILRRMLQECEVSNMDIEARLRQLIRQKEATALPTATRSRGDSALSGLHPDDPIEDRLARAIEDEVAQHPDALGIDSGPTDAVSIVSVTTHDPSRANWKNYIWNGASRKSSRAPSVASFVDREASSLSAQNRSRASSGAKATRKSITNDTFTPPTTDKPSGAVPALRRLQSNDHSDSLKRRSSSVSLASWALKMVAGNTQAGSASPVRGRKRAGSGPNNRTPSRDSTTVKPAVAGAQKRGRAMGPNGTIKNINTDMVAPLQPARGLSNLGPVEMDRILPEDSRPPTLVQHHNRFTASSEYLTDRFGFIYDQRRKKRQSEAAAALKQQKRNSNVESLGGGRSVVSMMSLEEEAESAIQDPSRPSSSGSDRQPANKTWADYLKLATQPTELLSHTPSAAPITTVTVESEPAPKASQITLTKRGSLPSSSINPDPAPSRVVSNHAELSVVPQSPGPATPITPYPPSQMDPVKSLLDQMSEVHDNIQKERTVTWNEFLRKVRAERKREGDATADGNSKAHAMPETLLTDGEVIGVASLGNKGKVGRAKWQEFRRLVLGGIPVTYRANIWAECSGATALRVPGYYQDLVNNGIDDPVIATQIEMDITRTLTDNIFFRTGPGVQKLNEVLLAYARRNPEVGYCQGMNLITASLLLIMPTAEDAFWILATMIENILPQNYYDQHLLTSRADQSVLRSYVVELLPKLSQHLDVLEIELEALTFQWFLSVFTDCLSAEALFRVWDVVLCMHDGSTFLFQVALALLKLNEKALLQCDTPADVYHYINHQMTNHAISIDGLIQASDALGKFVKRKDVEDRRQRAVAHEQNLMRQREEARQERARKRASQASVDPAPPTPRDADDEDAAKSISASLDAELALRTPISGTSTRSDEDVDAEALARELELTERTPMPMEEEVMWRA